MPMKLNSDQIRGLLRVLSVTREYELNCNEFLDMMAEFAERELADKPVPEALEAMQHHLTLCAQCSEEYEALLTALKLMRKDYTRTE
jgi:hypothetical protein